MKVSFLSQREATYAYNVSTSLQYNTTLYYSAYQLKLRTLGGKVRMELPDR